jgi:hypothetical protein
MNARLSSRHRSRLAMLSIGGNARENQHGSIPGFIRSITYLSQVDGRDKLELGLGFISLDSLLLLFDFLVFFWHFRS